MVRVLCTLPNVTSPINGVTFEQTEAGWLSADLDDEAARGFARIPGYQIVGTPETAPSPFNDSAPARRPARQPKA
ncbi:MAG: hypothetical protein RL456_3603 [Pseudomonadota bacterium]|jgi:hypothetical protein